MQSVLASLHFTWKPELVEHLLHRICSANSFVEEWQLDGGLDTRLLTAARSTFALSTSVKASDDRDTLEGLLTIVRDMCIEKESMETKVMSNGCTQRSGIECMDVFFDILNHLSGYHALNSYEDQQSNLN